VSSYDLRPLSGIERDKLAAELTLEEKQVMLQQGTERPFCGTLLNNKQDGIYACRLCGRAVCADYRYSRQTQSSNPAPGGRASTSRSIHITSRSW
jgi:hypothetical protein